MKTLLLALAAAAAVWAHHSMAGFDRTRTVTLEGTVQEFRWQNPHSSIQLDVPGTDGKVVTWEIEMTAPAYLVRQGWKRTTIKKGDKVTVVGNPLISGEPGAIFVSIKLPDGQTLPVPRGGNSK